MEPGTLMVAWCMVGSLSAAIAALIGRITGRAVLGGVLGFFLLWIGVVVMLVLTVLARGDKVEAVPAESDEDQVTQSKDTRSSSIAPSAVSLSSPMDLVKPLLGLLLGAGMLTSAAVMAQTAGESVGMLFATGGIGLAVGLYSARDVLSELQFRQDEKRKAQAPDVFD